VSAREISRKTSNGNLTTARTAPPAGLAADGEWLASATASLPSIEPSQRCSIMTTSLFSYSTHNVWMDGGSISTDASLLCMAKKCTGLPASERSARPQPGTRQGNMAGNVPRPQEAPTGTSARRPTWRGRNNAEELTKTALTIANKAD